MSQKTESYAGVIPSLCSLLKNKEETSTMGSVLGNRVELKNNVNLEERRCWTQGLTELTCNQGTGTFDL